MNLNRVELIGNLTANPVVKKMPSGIAIATFTLATRSDWKDRTTKEPKHLTEYHALVAYGKLGAVVEKYLKEGDKVYVDGRLKTTQWQGKDKSRRYKTEVIASNLIMLGSKPKTNDDVIVEEVSVDEELRENPVE